MLKKILFLFLFFVISINQLSFAEIVTENASPNYLVIMVHGIISNKDAFGGDNGLKQYLENSLGLKGYVYSFAYNFSNNRGSIINQARELGDPSHANPSWAGDMPSLSSETWKNESDWSKIYNNHSWISQSKDYYKAWFKWQSPNNPTHRDPTPNEVPKKVILLCHSMGGLAGTYYITSDFYQNDVQRVITLDTPHTGFDLAVYMNKYYSLDNVGKAGFTDDADKYIRGFTENIKTAVRDKVFGGMENSAKGSFGWKMAELFKAPLIENIYQDSTNWVIAAESWRLWNFYDFNKNTSYDFTCVPFLSSSVIELLRAAVFSGDGLSQMLPGSDFMKNLGNAKIKAGSDNIDFRLVSARGAPTPHRDLIDRYFLTTPYIAQQLIPWTAEYQALPNKSQKYWSLMFSMLFPGIFTVKDGSIAVSVDSSRGEGVDLFEKHDTKRYDVNFKSRTFEDAMTAVNMTYDACLAAYMLSRIFGGYAFSADIYFLPTKIMLTTFSLTLLVEDFGLETGANTGLKPHMVIPSVVTQKEADGTSIIDKTLDNIALVGGTTSTNEPSLTGLSVNSVTTSGYTAPQQAFVLLSDLDSKNQPTGIYHTVTIEAINYGNESRDQLFPINVDGEKRWVYSVTVKEPPTAMKAVVNTYLPKRLKRFNYSENFAAWKPVGEVDEWGNFNVKGLKLAEGQNVLSYDIETWTGLLSNKQIRVICNSIPLIASGFSPTPGIYTNNNLQTFKGKFGKAAYSGDPVEDISLKSAKLVQGTNEADVTSKVKVTIGGGAHDKYLWYEFISDEPLPDGYYTLIISVNSNIGASQASVDFTIDTKSPVVTMEALPAYSPRSPTVIRFSATDESPSISSVRCDLFDASDGFVTNIATADSLSQGSNYFAFDPSKISAAIPDGDYKIKIKVFDLANNYSVAEQPIKIDSTPPIISGVNLSPSLMTSNNSDLKLNGRVNERSNVIINLINTTNNTTMSYLAQAVPSSEGSCFSYAWNYDNDLTKGPEDGIYRAEIVARDEAGNESLPKTIEAFRIDRTPPKIYGQTTNPYVLANIGKDAYKTNLSYNLSDATDVKVKIYNANSGVLVDTIPSAPASNSAVNYLSWNGSEQPKGAYRFQIIATDDVGNIGTAYTSCVKDGIAPVISFPAEDNTEVTGVISIRGTAVDPDWTNDKPFKDYRVYYKKGQNSPITSPGPDWLTDFIEVPQVNRDPKDQKNISIRPLQNNSTLAYLSTNSLENGDYTILVIADEDGGQSIATTRVIKVNNIVSTSAGQTPFVKLKSFPASVEFKTDDSVNLPLGFINSIKPANVYLEVVKTGSLEAPVYFKYSPNVQGSPFTGKPEYKAGTDLGYFIWSDDNGYHLRWSADGSNHKFTGNIILTNGSGYSDVKQIGNGISVQSSLISWDANLSGGEGGVDFRVNFGQLMISPKIDEDPTKPTITADNIYLGLSKYLQQYLPIIIDAASQSLVDISSMGKKTANTSSYASPSTFLWNGKLESGAYVDNGQYVVRARAESVDGMGIATDESMVELKSPFELSIKAVTPITKEFSTLGGIDRVSVSYVVSKDSLVSANIFDDSGKFVAKLADNQEVLGSTAPSTIIWKGNYPDADSGQIVTSGKYKIVINVTAKDGSASKTETIDNISVASFSTNDLTVKLDPIGEETNFSDGAGLQKIRLASGDSPYFFEAKGIGRYHPPKDFTFTVTATGKQRLTAYPYVPFAALMHRYFNEVDTKTKVTFKIHAWNHYLGAQDNWSIGIASGTWWNPFKWRREREERPEVVWLEKDNLPDRTDKGLVFKKGDKPKSYQFEFDTNDWWHQNGDDWQWGKPNPGSGIDSVDVEIEVFAKDNSFVLDRTFSDLLPNSGMIPTFKGVFKAENIGTQYTTSYLTRLYSGDQRPRSYGAYRVNLNLDLEAPMDHSRLTNRFVPWFDFVRAGVPVNEKQNFSGYLDDLDKLGFPGKNYFDGVENNRMAAVSLLPLFTAPKSTPAPHEGSFNNSLFTGNANQLNGTTSANFPIPKVNDITTEAGSKMVGLANDYHSYLSDEHLEFIPITQPYGGAFEYSGKDISGNLELGKEVSYPIIAKTNLVYPSSGASVESGGIISPFKVRWPWVESDYTTIKNQQAAKRQTLVKELNGNMQSYTGPTWNQAANQGGTWWAFEDNEINERKTNITNTKNGSGTTNYDKGLGKSVWPANQRVGEFLVLPKYVDNPSFSLTSNTNGIKINPSTGDKNSNYGAEDLNLAGVDWTTTDDSNLIPLNGLIRSDGLIFNENEFLGRRELKLSDFYKVNNNSSFPTALHYAFLSSDPLNRTSNRPIDNPNIVITDWDVKLKDKTGNDNRDIVIEKVETSTGNDWQSHWNNDKLKLKLKLGASEARYVEITGNSSGPYELMYFDGNSWNTFHTSGTQANGHLAWWNVSRLNGRYTVLLRSGNNISTQDISIGTLVNNNASCEVYSTYKRAQLSFPKGAFGQDKLVTITPVSMNEIYIRNRPIIMTSGPIVEIKPSPWKFKVSTVEGVDQRPTLKFVYTFDDLAEPKMGLWNMNNPLPNPGTNLGLPMNIHQVTAGGDLQVISGNKQEVEINNGEHQYAFYAPLDHFSTYALLPGKFSLSAPMVFADNYITNKDQVTIYGTAEPESVVTVYVKEKKVPPEVEQGESYVGRMTAEIKTGKFRLENIPLIREGENYIYVTSHQEGNKDVRTFSNVTIIKDTIAPSVEATQNLFVFSPNGDGKYDSVDYLLKANEKGKIYFAVTSNANGVTRQLLNQDISAEANKEVKLTWTKDAFQIYRRDNLTGQWDLFSEIPINEKLADGLFLTTVYAIDEAGNISNNVISQTVVDTTPPIIQAFGADPNPFTPNDDGVKDTSKIWYKFNEPAYVTTNINRDDGRLFRSHEGPTEKFVYPTNKQTNEPTILSTGSWTWDGRGARNELLGGTYSAALIVTDNVGNTTTSEAKQIVVDREPTLVPYAYAEPDPFAPVNPNNNFTEIKYYLSRDNVKVSAAIVGEGGKSIKTLANDEVQTKGEHALRWYGDFNADYTGSTATGNKNRVFDGSYEFQLKVLDPDGGKPAVITNTVLVDNVPPVITTKPLVVDYIKKQAKLSYQLPENSSVEVAVYDSEGKLVDTLVTREAVLAGEYSLIYNLTPHSSSLIPHYFQITAIDRAQNRSQVTTEAFAVVPNQFQITHDATPNPFTPNGDSLNDQTRISYNLAGGVEPYKVSLTILNAAGATVKRLVDNEDQTAGTYSFYWDGKDDGKNAVIDGQYDYQVVVTDALGTRYEGRGTVLLVATRPSVDIATDLPIFSPNGDGAKDKVIFNYSINYPTFYITGEALVKIEVINGSSEVVWSKVFNNSAGNYVYEYNGLDSNGLPLLAGDYYVKISGQDALNSTAIPKTISLTVDYSQPEPTDFSINTAYAKLNADLRMKLNFPEPLAETPTVEVVMSNGVIRPANLISAEGNNYEYGYIVQAGDAEGPATVAVKARDLAFNPVLKTKTITIDKTNPVVSNLTVTPNPATVSSVNGQASIKFNVSEPLKEAPKVYVTQNGAASQLIPAIGQWSSTSGLCEARYDVVPGYDGVAQVSIEVTDLALNVSRFTTHDSLLVDTIKPVFSNVKSEIGDNPEFTKFAKEGAEVKITFDSSENLKFNPEVKVNQETATFSRRFPNITGESYEYKYTIKNSDTNGNANIAISGLDFALNEGTAETSTSSESFVIDLVNPTVVIAQPQTPGNYISQPDSFSTNANPDGTDKPRSTTFYYNLAERSKVTVKVYKVPDSQTAYAKTDFNNNNLIKVLTNDVWQEGNQTVTWDGKIDNNLVTYDDNNDGYAMPGKYAFIVEGRDRANNLTLKKWGGTVWAQDNVLTLREPEQFEYDAAHVNPGGNNPDPHYISPNGNSADPAQKQAKYYLMIDLSNNPTLTKPAERIEAQAVAGDTKKIGKYSINVYSDSALTNLVRAVVTNADAQSGTLTWEFWDGKNDAGQFVPNGTYYIVVDVKDFSGNSAVNNLLKLTVVVDNEKPVISNLSAAPYYFSPGNTNSNIKTTTLTYEVADNGNSSEVTVAVYKGANLTKTLFNGWKNNGTFSQVWDGTGDSIVDGIYTFKLSSTDQAGNLADVQTKEVVVDLTGPTIVLAGQPDETWYSADNNITVSLADNYSYQGFKWAWDNPPSTDPTGCNPSATGTTTHASQGVRTLYVNAWDSAGNMTQAAKTYKRDYTPPTATFGGQAADVWYVADNPITISLADTGGSDYRGFKWNWDSWPVNDPSGCSTATSASTTHGSTGPRTLFVRVWDNAGNESTYSKTYYRDITGPSITFGGQAADTWYSADNNITVSLADTYSYQGYKWSWDSWPSSDPAGCNGSSAGTTTHGGQGGRTLFVRAWDSAGNRTDSSKTYYRDSVAPTISQPGNGTFNPYVDGNIRLNFSVSDSSPSAGFSVSNITARIKYGSNIVKNLTVVDDGSGNYHINWDGTNNSNDYVNEGDYTLEISASDMAGNTGGTGGLVYVRLKQQITSGSNNNTEPSILNYYNQYMLIVWRNNYNQFIGKMFGPDFAANVDSAPIIAADPISSYAFAEDSGGYSHHVVLGNDQNVYYSRSFNGQTIATVKITNSGHASHPALCGSADQEHNVYLVWQDIVGDHFHVFFQKIPFKFASVNGTITMAIKGNIQLASSTIEAPTLIAPKDKTDKLQAVRPTFEWQHHKGNATQYNIDIAKNDTFSIAHQTFNKVVSSGSPDKVDANLYYYNYAIHEFDSGLDRDTYYWKVTALSTNEAATSETWSFTVKPDLTLSDVTNYPNPFNPNKEKTKIRYRLSTDASDVKIRIYDITGSLVNEIEGTTNGEGSSIWNKYNDVEWDGRNGRGDMVMNGIYPFEISAKLGDKTLSGRGKIAVLK